MLMTLCGEDPTHAAGLAQVSESPDLAGEIMGYPAGFCANHCDFLHQLAESMGNAVDVRDAVTYNHSLQVAEVASLLARALGLPPTQAETIHIAGHLHDIGKIGIPDAVLKKEGPLTDDDWLWIRKHPETGARITGPVQAFNGVGGITEIILCHHERYDGKGYPCSLRGNSIPKGARIIAVADTLSALLQDRPYRKGTGFEEAMEEIVSCSWSQFDPAVVRALKKNREAVEDYFRQRRFSTAV
jgi:putative nucleotidyltransferase with HDIG domain